MEKEHKSITINVPESIIQNDMTYNAFITLIEGNQGDNLRTVENECAIPQFGVALNINGLTATFELDYDPTRANIPKAVEMLATLAEEVKKNVAVFGEYKVDSKFLDTINKNYRGNEFAMKKDTITVVNKMLEEYYGIVPEFLINQSPSQEQQQQKSEPNCSDQHKEQTEQLSAFTHFDKQENNDDNNINAINYSNIDKIDDEKKTNSRDYEEKTVSNSEKLEQQLKEENPQNVDITDKNIEMNESDEDEDENPYLNLNYEDSDNENASATKVLEDKDISAKIKQELQENKENVGDTEASSQNSKDKIEDESKDEDENEDDFNPYMN